MSVDRRGVSALEFAILAPVMLGMICGTIDLGYLYMAQTSLVGAVAVAARSNVATQESSQSDRDAAMRTLIANGMKDYSPVPGGRLQIESHVYDDFGGVKPEPYKDANGNGQYDPPSQSYAGDPYTDRNGNGQWDADTPKSGTTGNTGDVVRYTATFPARHLFEFMGYWNGQRGVTLSATSVVRNEPVKTK